MGGDARQLLLDDAPHVGLGAVRVAAELRWHGVGAEERGHDVDGALAAELPGDVDQAQLGGEVEPVAGLGLDGGDAVGQHLVEPAAAVAGEVGRVGGTRHRDRRQDAAAGGEDLQVAGAALAQDQLLLARAREHEVGVRVHEPGVTTPPSASSRANRDSA